MSTIQKILAAMFGLVALYLVLSHLENITPAAAVGFRGLQGTLAVLQGRGPQATGVAP